VKKLINHFRYAIYLIVFAGFSSAHAGSYDEFFAAIKRDHPAMMKGLLAQGVDPNTVDELGSPGLVFALRIESYEAAAVLIDSPKLLVNAANPQGETALMMACLRAQQALAARLVQRGAAINRDGWSPLHYAAAGEDERMVAWLLQRAAEVNATAPNGNTPLMMAAQTGASASVEMLLAKSADVNRLNLMNLSAADIAEQGGRDHLAQRLRKLMR
jgi:ankyrin repeat protein